MHNIKNTVMKKITKKELKEILEQHKLWLDSDGEKGKCANLTDTDLRCADLRGADLRWVDLRGADLTSVDLTDAHLTCADLTDADLRCANLTDTDLRCADLTSVDLTDADLRCADLTDADLTSVDLTSADLTNASLTRANLTDTILDEGEQCRKGIVLTEQMIGYKKSNEGKIITIEIPIGAKVFSINNKKRRTNKCKVIDMQGETELSSMYENNFKYHVGDEIEIADFDERYNVECSTGIHFFLTRDEVEKY